MIKRNRKGILTPLLIAILIVLIINYLFFNTDSVNYKYYQIIDMFKSGKVSTYSVDFGSGIATLGIKRTEQEIKDYDQRNKDNETFNIPAKPNMTEEEKADYEAKKSEFEQRQKDKRELKFIKYKLANISVFLNDINPIVTEYNEQHKDNPIRNDYVPSVDTPWWINLLPTVLLFCSMAFLLLFMFRQSDGGGKALSFGKVKARQTIDDSNRVTFDDVAGADEEKEELAELVEFLKNPVKFNDVGARIPKGVLLVGPPGTGKTLLAKAVAGEANVPFFSISGSDFVEMFVGVGAKRVRELFNQAKNESPSIVFIDEIDAVGRQRGAGLGGGNDEREQTLNQLLVEMDGFSANQGVIIIAATNRRDVLDPALLRPGRFDRQIYVNRPDIKGREDILKVHSKNKPLDDDVNLNVVAKGTVGFTGADLSNVLNEAALLAARKNNKKISQKNIEDAIIKVIAGPEKKTKIISDEDKKLTAYHEAGHAITTYFCDKVDKVHEISIIPRGMAGGYTLSLPEKDESYKLKGQLEQEIVVLLGGRAAEYVVLDDISTGASNDIERVTQIARSMVTKYGFSDDIGPIVYGSDSNQVFLGRDYGTAKDYSELTANKIDSDVHDIVLNAYNKSIKILQDNIDKLHIVAKTLIEFEKIDGKTFEKIMESESIIDSIGEDNIIDVIDTLDATDYMIEDSHKKDDINE